MMQTSPMMYCKLVASCLLQLVLLAHITGAQQIVIFSGHPTLNQEVTIGDTVQLNCTIEAGQVLRWIFNNEPIAPDNSAYTISGGNLTIDSFQPSLAGLYRCVASRDGGKTQQVSHAGKVAYFAQRRFTVHPSDYTTYEDTPTNWYPEAPFQCSFSAVYYGVRPVITWEVQRTNGPIQSIPLPNLQDQLAVIDSNQLDPAALSRFRLGADSVTHRQVIFQRNYTGFFQLHFPDPLNDDGMMVRCVATHPHYNTQYVKSNWATLTMKDGPIPSDVPIFSSYPPLTVSAIDGQDLVLDCTKGIRNVSSSIQWYYNGQDDSNIISNQGVDSGSLAGGSPYGYSNYYLNTSSPHYNTYIGNYFYCAIIDTNNTVRFMAVQIIPSVPVTPCSPSNGISDGGYFNYMVPIGGKTNFFALSVNQWWFRGALVTNSSQYEIKPDALVVKNATMVDGGIYQAEINISTTCDAIFQLFLLTIDVGTISQNIHWKEPITIHALVPPSPNGYTGSPVFSDRLTMNSNGDLVSNGELTYIDNATYNITSNDFLAQGTLHLSITVMGTSQVTFHWRSPVLAVILPMATEEYSVSPPLSQRLYLGALGILSSIGQLKTSDAGTYMISSNQFHGTLALTLSISIEDTLMTTLYWLGPSSVPLMLPTAPSGYTSNPPLSSRLSITNSGELVSTGQLQASDAGTYMITSSDFTGVFMFSITTLNISGVEHINTMWMIPLFVKILPDGFPEETRDGFNTSSSGHLVSDGLLLVGSSSYEFSGPAYEGVLSVIITVNAPGYVLMPLQDIDARNKSRVVLQCSANGRPLPVHYVWKKDGVQIANSTDDSLVLTEVSPLDVGVYTCCPSNTLGTFNTSSATINVEIALSLVWLMEHRINILSRGQYLCIDKPDRSNVPFQLSDGGYLSTSSNLDLTDTGLYECISDISNASLTIYLTIIGHEPVQPTISSVSLISDNNQLIISWSDVASSTRPVEEYQLEVTRSPLPTGRERRQSTTMILSTTRTSLNIEYNSQQQYSFRLRAINSAGSSNYSDEYQFRLPPPTDGIGPPTSNAVLPVVLIMILLLSCCLCCWICIIAIVCFHRKKQRKSYPAEDREKKFRDDERYSDVRYRSDGGDVESDIIELAVAPVVTTSEDYSNQTGAAAHDESHSASGQDDSSHMISNNEAHGARIKPIPTYIQQTDV